MTEPSTPADLRPRSALPGIVAILALIVAGCALWVSYGNSTKAAAPQEQAAVTPPPPDPAVGQIKETLSSLQQSVNGIRSDQQKQAAQLNDIQQKASAQQGEQKLISEQLGALSGRVNSLESAKAESPAAAPQTAPGAQKSGAPNNSGFWAFLAISCSSAAMLCHLPAPTFSASVDIHGRGKRYAQS